MKVVITGITLGVSRLEHMPDDDERGVLEANHCLHRSATGRDPSIFG